MLNRGAFTLRYKQPAVDWINAADPAVGARPMALAEVNQDLTIYLVEDAVVETPAAFRRWLKLNHRALIEHELEAWYTDPALWPKDRGYAMFDEWFQPEIHTVIEDLAGGELYDDGL
jgi:hypothetical protein